MKMIAATIAALLITAATGCARDSAPPCYVMIGVAGGPTNATLTLQGKTVSLEEMGRLMKRLGAISTEQVILVGVDAESSSHRLLAVLKVLTDAGLKNVCVLPKGSAGLTAQHLRVLTKTNEFFQVEIEELTEPEIIDITEEGRIGSPGLTGKGQPRLPHHLACGSAPGGSEQSSPTAEAVRSDTGFPPSPRRRTSRPVMKSNP